MEPIIDIKVLNQIQYGMFIVTSHWNEKINGQIATVVFQVTCNPTLIATCLNKANLTHDYVMQSKSFAVSILSEAADLKFIGDFGFKTGRNINKFHEIDYKTMITGSPLVLNNAVGIFDCKVQQTIDAGMHSLFIGELLAAEKLNDDIPMTYAFYHNVIKGKTQKNAPTYNYDNQCKVK